MESQEVVNYNEIPVCMFCLEGSDIEEVEEVTCPGGKGCVMYVHGTCLEDWDDYYLDDPSCPLCRKKTSGANVGTEGESNVIVIRPSPRTNRVRVHCSRDRTKDVITWCIRGLCAAGGVLALVYCFVLKS